MLMQGISYRSLVHDEILPARHIITDIQVEMGEKRKKMIFTWMNFGFILVIA